jgi:mono/diheme cytochrome c family protein
VISSPAKGSEESFLQRQNFVEGVRLPLRLRAAAILPLLALCAPALAQDLPGNVTAGRQLALAWCQDCHRVDAAGNMGGVRGPAFTEIARLPSTTALSLRVFLRTSHDNNTKLMPNLQLSQPETDDLVAYIISLKSR